MAERLPAPVRGGALVLACVLALRAVAGSPGEALDDLQLGLTSTADPFAAVVPTAAVLAWALVLWLSAVAALTLAAGLPGVIGRCGGAAAVSLAPAAVRRLVQLALGVGLAAGVTCASPASAAPLTEGPSAAGAAAPSLDWPSITPPPAAPPPATTPPPAPGAVVVAPGDTLWSLAERALGPGATAPEIAAAWPSWWVANRDVVGADPHVIHPGDRLVPPPSTSTP